MSNHQNISCIQNKEIIYRVTGAQSIERLEPLLHTLLDCLFDVKICEFDCHSLDIVWETSCEKTWHDRHVNAFVINRLHNTSIIENKGNLAFLQLKMSVPVLESYVANNLMEMKTWFDNRWNGLNNQGATPAMDWWVVKASKGNGGKDVWIINANNFSDIISSIPKQEELVIQKYIINPMLYRGRKFHFRCYALLLANMVGYVYNKAYILSASDEYDCSDVANSRHITNLSVNKHSPGHPGQVPCHIMNDYPQVFEQICNIWRSVVEAMHDFMVYQRNQNHFEYFGFDIIVDEDGVAWLIEINRQPGVESSNNNKQEEDKFYNEMLLRLLDITFQPLYENHNVHVTDYTLAFQHAIASLESQADGNWIRVKDAYLRSEMHRDATLWKNIMNWKLYTRKSRSKVLVNA